MTEQNRAPETPNANPGTVRAMDSQVLANVQQITTRLEVQFQQLEKCLDKHDQKLDKISDDVDKLRTWRAVLIASFTVATLFIGTLITFVGWSVNKATDVYLSQLESEKVNQEQTDKK